MGQRGRWRYAAFGDLHLPEKCSRGSFDDSPGLEAAFHRLRGDERAGIEDFDFQADADLLLQLVGDAAFQVLALLLGQRGGRFDLHHEFLDCSLVLHYQKPFSA